MYVELCFVNNNLAKQELMMHCIIKTAMSFINKISLNMLQSDGECT